MATMRTGPYEVIGPSIQTTWGTIPSPHIMGAPSQLRHAWLPPTMRTRHDFRSQPRPLGPGRGARGFGQDNHQKETRWGLYLFLGAVGFAAVMFTKRG